MHAFAYKTGIVACAYFEDEPASVDFHELAFACDDAGLIGEGMHERFIINTEKFMARTEAKLK